MAHARRIERLADCPTSSGKRVEFQFEGRVIEGFTEEPLAVALLAAGIRVFGRSVKYHRPRGPACLRAHCSGCLMRVDGMPNVRTCETLCRAGQVVERQTGWPGAGHDVFRALDWVYPDGMKHHEIFTASTTINRLALPFVRKLTGFGASPSDSPPLPHPLKRFAAEAVVVGAGASGLTAARTLAESGVKVLLLEADEQIGGRLLDASSRVREDSGKSIRAWELWQSWKASLDRLPNLDLRLKTPVLAVYPGDRPQVLAKGEEETLLIDADRLLFCTGAYELIPLFGNNDLSGILGLRALDRLVFRHGVVPGEPIAIVGESDQALTLALMLNDCHVRVAGVVTNRRDGELVESIKRQGISLIADRCVIRARGGRWLQRLELAPADRAEPDVVLDCAVCAAEAPAAPAYELAHHVGCRVVFHSESGYSVMTDDEGRTTHNRVFAAGHCALASSLSDALAAGERAGRGLLNAGRSVPGPTLRA